MHRAASGRSFFVNLPSYVTIPLNTGLFQGRIITKIMTGFLKQSLQQLLSELPCRFRLVGEWNDARITGMAMDSRTVLPGNLFFAISGENADGHRYIQQALDNGAAGVVGEKPIEGLPVAYMQTGNSREVLGHVSAAFYGYSARNLTVIGVTGTVGNTTTFNLLFQIMMKTGLHAGII